MRHDRESARQWLRGLENQPMHLVGQLVRSRHDNVGLVTHLCSAHGAERVRNGGRLVGVMNQAGEVWAVADVQRPRQSGLWAR